MRVLIYNTYPVPLDDVSVTLPIQNFYLISQFVPYDLYGKGIVTHGVSKEILDSIDWNLLKVREVKTLDDVDGYEKETDIKYIKTKNRGGDYLSIISPYSVDIEEDYNCTFHSPYYPSMMNHFFSFFTMKQKGLKFPKHVKIRWNDPILLNFLEFNKVKYRILDDDLVERFKKSKINLGGEDIVKDMKFDNFKHTVNKQEISDEFSKFINEKINQDKRI